MNIILNEDGRCQECKLKNKTTENFLKITVDCRDIDCVKSNRRYKRLCL